MANLLAHSFARRSQPRRVAGHPAVVPMLRGKTGYKKILLNEYPKQFELRCWLQGLHASRAKAPFVSRSFSNSLDFSGDGCWRHIGTLRTGYNVVHSAVSVGNDEYSYCRWVDFDDVPASCQGAIRAVGRSLPE